MTLVTPVFIFWFRVACLQQSPFCSKWGFNTWSRFLQDQNPFCPCIHSPTQSFTRIPNHQANVLPFLYSLHNTDTKLQRWIGIFVLFVFYPCVDTSLSFVCATFIRDRSVLSFLLRCCSKAVNKAYEEHVLSVGNLDERIFLGDDADEEIGTLRRCLNATSGSETAERVQMKYNLQEHFERVSIAWTTVCWNWFSACLAKEQGILDVHKYLEDAR